MGEIKDIKLGITQVDKLYCGTDLVFEKVTDATAPITSMRPFDATNNPDRIYSSAQTIYFDVNEMADTYYTLDGTTPTTASTKYTGDGIFTDTTTTFKYFSVDTSGNVETVKTTMYTINAVDLPTTTISPTGTVQNTIPFTVTLSTDEVGATIYYRLGTGTQKTYTGPFEVNQNIVGVQSTNIKVTYWAVGAEGTEAEKSITYDTSGALCSAPLVSATAGAGNILVEWTTSQNATAYTVYKSTVSGTLGTFIAETQYMTGLSYTDTDVIAGTTYYYTIRASNYGDATDSAQASATPTEAPTQPSWRYLKIEGYGSVEESATTRLIEFEAWEGTTNRMVGATIVSHDPIDTGGGIAVINDGAKLSTGYPIWWLATPNANVVVDLLAERPLTTLNYYSYSTTNVQRANRFRVLASNTNNGTDWVEVWNMSTNTTPQPVLPDGYEIVL